MKIYVLIFFRSLDHVLYNRTDRPRVFCDISDTTLKEFLRTEKRKRRIIKGRDDTKQRRLDHAERVFKRQPKKRKQ